MMTALRPELHPGSTGSSHETARSASSYERELAGYRSRESELRETIARDEERLSELRKLIDQHDILSKESDHRLLNSLQLIVSLLSLQSRSEASAAASSQLATAAGRVATIARIHRRLHSLDGVKTVDFRRYLDDLCNDFSTMLASKEQRDHFIAVEGEDLQLPTAVGIPLACIVNELITNAVKHGKGLITVRLSEAGDGRQVLSVANQGPRLPADFDIAACKGLGMSLISALVAQIGGELRVEPGEMGEGANFSVFFSTPSRDATSR